MAIYVPIFTILKIIDIFIKYLTCFFYK